MVDEESVADLQELLLSQWDNPYELGYSYHEEALMMKRCMMQTIENHRSATVLFYGPVHDVRKVVHAVVPPFYTQGEVERTEEIRMATIDGSVYEQDSDALIDIVNQFVLNRPHERQLQASLEDFEEYLQHCHLEGLPAVLFLENFHIFATRRRQTLLYTLLDQLHRPDHFFLLILHSESVSITSRLEKRVISRLNSLPILLGAPTAEALAIDLFLHLSKGIDEASTHPVAQGNDNLVSSSSMNEDSCVVGEEEDIPVEPLQPYRAAYLAALSKALGVPRSNSPASLALWEREWTLDSPGELLDAIRQLVDIGFSRRDFLDLCLTVISSLCPARPFPDKQAFLTAIDRQLPVSNLADLLQNLCSNEVALYVAAARLHCQISATGHQGQGRQEIVVDDVLCDFDKLTDLFQRKAVPMSRITQWLAHLSSAGLITLWSGTRGQTLYPHELPDTIEAHTVLTVNHTAEEIHVAFQLPHDRPKEIWRCSPMPGLVVPERLRRAVLQPMQPLLYTMGKNDSSMQSLA